MTSETNIENDAPATEPRKEPQVRALYLSDGGAIRLLLRDGDERTITLKHRADMAGMDPIAHACTMLAAGLVEAHERIAVIEQAVRPELLRHEFERLATPRRSWWQRFTKWWNTGLGW
ncbi:MAG TPA: hypothetical protein VGD46_25010 [Rhizobacter sp.]